MICSKCKTDKNRNDFVVRKGRPKGISSHCRICLNKATQEWRARSQTYLREYDKRYYQEHKKKEDSDFKDWDKRYTKEHGFGREVKRKYGLETVEALFKRENYSCQMCNTTQKLCVHHIDKKGVGHHKRTGEINNSLPNLMLLCNSCHGKLHHAKEGGRR